MIQRLILCCILLVLIGAEDATAKWWIFGQSQDAVATRYLYLNDISYDELGEKVTLYRDTLADGQVFIKGRGQAGTSKIGAVQISVDDGANWQRAQLASDGSFQFSFRPQMGEVYPLQVKILDTAGKSNEVSETRKELTVSDSTIRSVIRNALDGLISAYRYEEPREFMRFIDGDFAGDAVILESAILKDFTALDQIEMRYTLNSVVAGEGGKVFVSISFSRQVVVARTGEVLQDFGQTEFIFSMTGEKALVYAMKNPLIFGLSEAEDVATGDTNTATNTESLTIGRDGVARLSSDGDDNSFASVVPTPTNLIVDDFVLHHKCSFIFNFPIDHMAVDLSVVYEIVLEEALSPTGPWTEVERDLFWDPKFVNITTTNIASNQAMLYYRVIVEELGSGDQSLPTNVVSINNN